MAGWVINNGQVQQQVSKKEATGMKRRNIVLAAILAAIGLVTLVAYVQGAGPFAKPCSTTSGVEAQAVHMANGAASGTGCCAVTAAAGEPKAGCAGNHDGKCSGDCTACPAMKEGTCAGSTSGCDVAGGACPATASAPTTASTPKATGGCPGSQASAAKPAGCGGCPFATK